MKNNETAAQQNKFAIDGTQCVHHHIREGVKSPGCLNQVETGWLCPMHARIVLGIDNGGVS